MFTHGPLGFLAQPRSPVWWTALLSLGFVWVVRAALCWTVLHALRERFGLPVAAALGVALTYAVHSETAEVLVSLALVLALLTVRGRLPVLPEAGGALAAVATLVKFNAGVAVGFFVFVALLARAPRRLWRAAAAYVVTFVAVWLLTGNSLRDVPAWLRGSYELAAGYTAAMASELPGLGWHYALAPVLVVLVVGLGVTVPERRARWACGLLLLGGLAMAVKHGFVRHDAHAAAFFLPVALAPVALLGRRRADALALGTSGVAAAVAFSLLGSAVVPGLAFGSAAADALLPARRDAAREAARAAVAVDPEVLAAVGDRTVHVDPWEVSVAWSYGLRWEPVPVLQSYSAYTPYLDRLDAAAVRSGPDVVLRPRAPRAVDGRVPSFESPEYALALVCAYRAEVTGRHWQLLARGPWRCGDPVRVGSVAAGPADMVPVPPPSAPDRVVYARIELDVPLPVRVRDLVFKSPADRIELDGRSFRFVRPTAAQPLVLRVPDGAVAPGAPSERSVATLRVPGWSYRVDFFEVALGGG